jgi:hypothetical protein
MYTIIADLLVLGVIGYCGMLGYARGLRPALVVALELFFSLALGLLLTEMVAMLLGPVIASVGGRDFDAEAWGTISAFLMLFGVIVAALQAIVPPGLVHQIEDDDSFADDKPLSQPEQIGGAILGGVCGLLLVGVGLITLSMVPLPTAYRFQTTAMLYDVGAFCLRGFSHVAGGGHSGRAILVFGEPASTAQEPTARLSSEGYTDLDGDGKYNDGDAICDLDDSGTYSRDLYYLDLDGDSMRKVGMLEKYVTTNWGINQTVQNRERPGATPAAPPPPPSEEGGESEQPAAVPAPPSIPPPSIPVPDEPAEPAPAAPAGDDF